MITPQEIVTKAENVYKKFLSRWVQGDDGDFFPYRVPADLKLDRKDVPGTIAAVETLMSKSKSVRGWGYSVRRKQVGLRDFGKNPVPVAISIETLEDLLRLARKEADFAATCAVAVTLRKSLPGLSEWVARHAGTLAKLQTTVADLIAVTEFFIAHPWPDCYARQIPIPVDTKFVDRHRTLLRQWLDILLPATAIDVNESRLEHRYGLRDGQPHRAIRVLDEQLLTELRLSFDELSLPLRLTAQLPICDATIVIVENDLNLLTLPALRRGMGIRGEGKAVTRLEKLAWLNDNRIIYWGDIDVEGFQILSSLRNLFPHVESILMDRETWDRHREFAVPHRAGNLVEPSNLSDAESAMFRDCLANGARLEQEKVIQRHVDAAFALLP